MRRLLKDRKGIALYDLKAIVLTLIVLGMLFGVGMYILGEMRYQVDVSKTEAFVNESLDSDINETTTQFFDNSSLRDCSITDVVCVNESDAATAIDSGNYTVSGCGIVYSGDDPAEGYNMTTWNCSGITTYSDDTSAATAVTNVSKAGNNLASWLPLILIILAAALVIGIVIRSFGGRVA